MNFSEFVTRMISLATYFKRCKVMSDESVLLQEFFTQLSIVCDGRLICMSKHGTKWTGSSLNSFDVRFYVQWCQYPLVFKNRYRKLKNTSNMHLMREDKKTL